MIEFAGIVAMILAIAGVLLNNRRLILCFPIWMVLNLITLFIHSHAGIWSLAVRDLAFFILAIEGMWRWRRGK